MSLTILRKVVWVGAGVAAFVATSVGISLLSMVVSALMPGASPDREGRLEPSPEETARAEWLRKKGASQETQPSTQSTETADKPSEPEPQPEEPQPAPQPQEPERSAPPPVVSPTPPRAPTGPGNLDAPFDPPPPPAPQVGSGNL